jgi:dephospho-CoA kinase
LKKSEMLRVGLTGSIGVGKSFVTSIFAELGCHTLDADQTARQVVEKGSEGLAAVVQAFGRAALQEDGTLNRKQVGDLIFADPKKRELLNSILHPFIIAAQDEQMRAWERDHTNGIAVVDAALMIESGGYKRFDKLIVVHCRPEVQRQRLMARNSISAEEADRRIAAQMPQTEKMKFADYLIDSSEGFESTRKQAVEVYNKLVEASR